MNSYLPYLPTVPATFQRTRSFINRRLIYLVLSRECLLHPYINLIEEQSILTKTHNCLLAALIKVNVIYARSLISNDFAQLINIIVNFQLNNHSCCLLADVVSSSGFIGGQNSNRNSFVHVHNLNRQDTIGRIDFSNRLDDTSRSV